LHFRFWKIIYCLIDVQLLPAPHPHGAAVVTNVSGNGSNTTVQTNLSGAAVTVGYMQSLTQRLAAGLQV
jgi:hypothetical protein